MLLSSLIGLYVCVLAILRGEPVTAGSELTALVPCSVDRGSVVAGWSNAILGVPFFPPGCLRWGVVT